MKKNQKKKQDVTVSKAPIETVIPLEQPVKIYTAKELAAMPLSAMPLSAMNAAIEAQEKFYMPEETTHMGALAIKVRLFMEYGHPLIQVKEKSRTRYKIKNEFVPPRIIRQLESRGLVKLKAVK